MTTTVLILLIIIVLILLIWQTCLILSTPSFYLDEEEGRKFLSAYKKYIKDRNDIYEITHTDEYAEWNYNIQEMKDFFEELSKKKP